MRIPLVLVLFIIMTVKCHVKERAYFMAVEEPWLMSILDAKHHEWVRDGIYAKFKLSGKEILKVSVHLPSRLYDFDRKWRTKARAYIQFIHPQMVKQVYQYGSAEFLSAFEPKIDVQYDVYVGNSVYGTVRDGILKWKKGIY